MRVPVGSRMISLRAGEVLIEPGPTDLYRVISGCLAVTAAARGGSVCYLTTLGPGDIAGAPAGESHPARVTALQPSAVERLSHDDAHSMAAAGRASLRRLRILLALHLSDLFGELDAPALEDLLNELELVAFSGGDVLLRRGEPGDCLYLIVSGRVRVLVPPDEVVAEVGVGEIVGEMALLSGEPRAATVHAIRDTQAARLSRDGLERFMTAHPRAALNTFTRKVVQRLSAELAGTRRRHPISTVAVAAAHPGVPIRAFAEGLSAALGSAAHITRERLDAALGQGAAEQPETSPRNLAIVEWLNNQELERDYLVYECDSSMNAWTRRCLRQADHVLLVGTGHPPAHEVEVPVNAPRSLVLLETGSGAREWLARTNVDRHYHVHPGSRGDLERVARFLTGRAFGLALGGGFARGLVHVGVIRALNEAGIAIDAIGGNSMGAIIGALWAQGWDEERILRDAAPGCEACIRGMTLPMVAFKSGGAFSSLVRRLCGDARIEDLRVPFFCVSVNLNRAELKVHTEGPLTKALLASSRVPVVFPPVIYDGEMHVDGGLLNNVPVDVMRRIAGDGYVLGVEPAPGRQFDLVRDYGFDLTGWQALWARLRPFGDKAGLAPSLLQIVLRTMEFGRVSSKGVPAEADVYLRPPLQGFKPTDFSAAADIVRIGYESARAALDEWLGNPDIPPSRKPVRSCT